MRTGDGISARISIGDAARKPPPISKSDEAFREDGVEFVWGAAGIDVQELNELFERVRGLSAVVAVCQLWWRISVAG